MVRRLSQSQILERCSNTQSVLSGGFRAQGEGHRFAKKQAASRHASKQARRPPACQPVCSPCPLARTTAASTPILRPTASRKPPARHSLPAHHTPPARRTPARPPVHRSSVSPPGQTTNAKLPNKLLQNYVLAEFNVSQLVSSSMNLHSIPEQPCHLVTCHR